MSLPDGVLYLYLEWVSSHMFLISEEVDDFRQQVDEVPTKIGERKTEARSQEMKENLLGSNC